jgi:hypothetical protein
VHRIICWVYGHVWFNVKEDWLWVGESPESGYKRFCRRCGRLELTGGPEGALGTIGEHERDTQP